MVLYCHFYLHRMGKSHFENCPEMIRCFLTRSANSFIEEQKTGEGTHTCATDRVDHHRPTGALSSPRNIWDGLRHAWVRGRGRKGTGGNAPPSLAVLAVVALRIHYLQYQLASFLGINEGGGLSSHNRDTPAPQGVPTTTTNPRVQKKKTTVHVSLSHTKSPRVSMHQPMGPRVAVRRGEGATPEGWLGGWSQAPMCPSVSAVTATPRPKI